MDYLNKEYEIQQAGRLLIAIGEFAGRPEDLGLLSKIKGRVTDTRSLIQYDVAVLSQDTEGILNFCNSGASDLFGYEKGDIICTPTSRLVPANMARDRTRMFDDVIGEGRLIVEETERLHKNGSIIQIRGHVFPYELDNERCIAAVVERL